jgi:hypothetical protein
MGTWSGADFHHHQQQQPTPQGLPPPLRPNGRAPTLQTSLSLGGAASSEQVGSPPDTQEPLSNSDGGHDSATERASSRETWPGEPGKSGGGGPPVAAAPITALRIADNKEKEVVGNGAAELRSCFMFSSTTSETFSGHIAHKPMLVL